MAVKVHDHVIVRDRVWVPSQKITKKLKTRGEWVDRTVRGQVTSITGCMATILTKHGKSEVADVGNCTVVPHPQPSIEGTLWQ